MWLASSIAATGPPAASADLLFVAESRALGALRVADGSTAWELPFAGSLAAPLVWDNGWLVAAAIDGTVIAFRAGDGHEVWRRGIGSPAHASPALAADRVYVPTEDGRVVALRVDTGEPVWEHRLGGAASDILALDERLYVGSRDNFFYCLDTRDGEEVWRVRTGADVIGMPVADEHNVYFVSLDNVLRAVRRNGNQQWKSALKIRPTAGPIKAGDTLIVAALEQTLPAFRTKDGTSAGEIAPGGEVTAAPHVVAIPGVYGPVVVVVTRDVAKGAAVVAQAREIDPPLLTPVSPLPNLITLTPVATSPTVPKP
jgi:outer membrane protein assembly factor BamB